MDVKTRPPMYALRHKDCGHVCVTAATPERVKQTLAAITATIGDNGWRVVLATDQDLMNLIQNLRCDRCRMRGVVG